MKLEGRVAFVTGAAQGIGRAIALALAEDGADLALGDLNLEKLEATAREVEGLGRKALALHLDVSSSDSVLAAVTKVLETWGKIDRVALTLAGIIGRRMAREDYAARVAANDNRPVASEGMEDGADTE